MGKVLTVSPVDLALLVYLYKLEPWLYFFFVDMTALAGFIVLPYLFMDDLTIILGLYVYTYPTIRCIYIYVYISWLDN
jgi:hypothetical protein